MCAAPRVSTRLPVWVLVLFTGSVWGAGGLASKWLVNRDVDAFVVTAGPFLVAAALAWAIAVSSGDLRRSAIGAGVLLGIVNTSIPALFFNLAYETLPAGLVTLILSLGPVVTAGVAHFVFADERFNGQKGLGLLLAFAGVGALVAAPGVIEGASYRGALWTVAGAVIAGSSSVLVRRLAMRHGARALLAPQLTAAGLTPVVAGIAVGRTMVPVGGFTVGEVALLAAIGIVASYGGFRALMTANETGTTGQVSMVAYVLPLVGVVGGIILFDEQLTRWIVVGAALILTGVTFGGRGSRPNEAVTTPGERGRLSVTG